MDISIALGGGGAKGNSHIGVLRRLEGEGFKIKAVAGTSFGGIVAALYAAGNSPDKIQNIFCEVDQSRLYSRSAQERPALLGLAGVRNWLDEVVGQRTFADLTIPCALTAVDLNCGCEVILDEGRIPGQGKELLGPVRSREGPEPRSGPPCQNRDPEMRVRYG